MDQSRLAAADSLAAVLTGYRRQVAGAGKQEAVSCDLIPVSRPGVANALPFNEGENINLVMTPMIIIGNPHAIQVQAGRPIQPMYAADEQCQAEVFAQYAEGLLAIDRSGLTCGTYRAFG